MSMPSKVERTPNCADSRVTVRDLGRVQQRLGRDAAAVQARAADLVLLDQADGEAELGGAQRGRVAAAAAAEDDEVKVLLGHPATPLRNCICDTDCQPVVIGAGCMGDDSSPHTTLLRLRRGPLPAAMSVRTATPVGPLPVNPQPPPVLYAGPAMSRCAHGMRGASGLVAVRADELAQEQRRRTACRRPGRPSLAFAMSATSMSSIGAHVARAAASATAVSPTRAAAATHPVDQLRRRP